MLDAEVELPSVSRLLGHARLNISSDSYAGRVPASMRRAAEELERTLTEGHQDDTELGVSEA